MSFIAENVASEVAGEVEIKFTKNMPGSKDNIIIITEGETVAKVIKRKY